MSEILYACVLTAAPAPGEWLPRGEIVVPDFQNDWLGCVIADVAVASVIKCQGCGSRAGQVCGAPEFSARRGIVVRADANSIARWHLCGGHDHDVAVGIGHAAVIIDLHPITGPVLGPVVAVVANGVELIQNSGWRRGCIVHRELGTKRGCGLIG